MPNAAKIILLDSQPIQMDAGNALPTRLKIMAWGANPGSKGTFTVNASTLSQLPGNQRAANFDRIAFDFEHNTVKGSPSYAGEPAKVAGHGTPEIIDGEGMFLTAIEWTEAGREYVGGRHYIDVSPSIITNKAGEVIFIH